MRYINRLILGLGLLALLIAGCTSSADLPGEGVDVRLGRATWDTGWFQAHIFKVLLEELGYTVRDTEPLENLAFFFFAAQGDVDFWANGWFPLHDRYLEYNQVADRVRPVGFQVKNGALQGYLIDKVTADEYGITNMGDLQDPALAALFDNDGDGKADLIGCNVGWACAQVTEHHLDAYHLRDTVTHVQGDYSELADETVNRFEQGEPILFYTWTPNWTVSELIIAQDVAWLSVPFSALPSDPRAYTVADSIDGCLETPCDMGFEVNHIRIAANAEFLEANPAAARLFELVELPLEDIAAQNTLMRAGENSEEDLRRHAEAWIEANRAQVDDWLAKARAAAQAAG
ncbi:MAG: glycine betaine/L-proline ABC transporter substrate-binding protein ProX [Chloroflexota bacterium]|nr:MAG: glycine betaine/L-proline ABC transporter substrate-binding protein ProX [Chloroflexota bacterium]